ncbi:hypothetical protein QYE77_11185 [Thermanaerothrix sp. 4228-RoL]|uniref:DUF3109 family protein n=1 Tax=Thermanaerothrix solaris TaxID=3058434 RepID=A0ABU3NR23_9CHLR|nr:hypothetical protein [Thermanaerothrix sp. 4228-RoL]MDT8898825.1 hypothetical protein [Thermanaerothrix sp. 4228-RoL]
MIKQVNPRLLMREPLQRCGWPQCQAACCAYGVWLDEAEWRDILAHVNLILPYLPIERRDPVRWVDGRCEEDPFVPSGRVVHTRVYPDPTHYAGSACVFLRSDYKCALQVAGEAAGYHPWRFKPFYCILHPLDLDEEGRITLDEAALLAEEAASCLRWAEKAQPLLDLFAEELRYLLGDAAYEALRERSVSAHPPQKSSHERI